MSTLGQTLAELWAERKATSQIRDTQAWSYREFITHPDVFPPGIIVVSPMIQAIVDASEAQPITTLDDVTCRAAFGGHGLDVFAERARRFLRPRKVVVQAGRRSGKTRHLGATKALHAAWTVPYPHAAKDEPALVAIVAPEKINAAQCAQYVNAFVQQSPILSSRVVRHTEAWDGAVVLRRPDGVKVEVDVVLPKSAGAGLRRRQILGVVFDEASFMAGEGMVEDAGKQMEAALGGMQHDLAQAWMITTPWIAGEGLVEEEIEAFRRDPFGSTVAASRVHSNVMLGLDEPDAASDAERRGMDQSTYDREIRAVPMTQGTQGLFRGEAVNVASTRTANDITDGRVKRYVAGADVGLARHTSACVIGEQRDDIIALRDGDILAPSKNEPLALSQVAACFAPLARRYGVMELHTDRRDEHEFRRHLAAHHVALMAHGWSDEEKAEAYNLAAEMLNDVRGPRVIFGDLPERVREQLARDLKRVVRRPRSGGGYDILLPVSTWDSRGMSTGNADVVAALMMLLVGSGVLRKVPQETHAASSAPTVQPTVRTLRVPTKGLAGPRKAPRW